MKLTAKQIDVLRHKIHEPALLTKLNNSKAGERINWTTEEKAILSTIGELLAHPDATPKWYYNNGNCFIDFTVENSNYLIPANVISADGTYAHKIGKRIIANFDPLQANPSLETVCYLGDFGEYVVYTEWRKLPKVYRSPQY